MGLAASQGRYLCLTARNSDLIYEAQQISQQRLALTDKNQEIANKYNDAMNNKIMQVTTPEGEKQRLTYEVLTSQDPFSGLCMRIVDANGNVVVPKRNEHIAATSKNEQGEDVTNKVYSAYEFVSLYMTDLDSATAADMSNKSLAEVAQYYSENYQTSGVTVQYNANTYDSLKEDGERFCYDEGCLDPEYLQRMLTTGEWFVQQVSTEEEQEPWSEISWQGTKNITEVFDTSDDAAAEAEYEAALTEIQKQDKLLELRLEQVQTQQQSVQTELESIKQVIDKNVEESFKTFA